MCRCLPYTHFPEVYWPHETEDVFKVELGGWLVVLRDHQLQLLYEALLNHTLKGVAARPELARERGCDADSYVTELAFTVPPVEIVGGLIENAEGNGQLPLTLTGLD